MRTFCQRLLSQTGVAKRALRQEYFKNGWISVGSVRASSSSSQTGRPLSTKVQQQQMVEEDVAESDPIAEIQALEEKPKILITGMAPSTSKLFLSSFFPQLAIHVS